MEDSSGSPKPLELSGCRPLFFKSEELQTGLKRRPGRRVGGTQAPGREVGNSRPHGQGQTTEVSVMANASKEDIRHLDGPKSRKHQMIGTPKGLRHMLNPLEFHPLGHPRGHAPGHLNLLPTHWCGGVQSLATNQRYFAHPTLFIQRETVEGGAKRPLPYRTRHIRAAVQLPELGGRRRVILPGEVGLVPHLGGCVAYRKFPKDLAYPPILPTAEERKIRHRPFGDVVEGIIHPTAGRPYGRHTTTVDRFKALFANRPH